MKYIVSGHSVLKLASGADFTLSPGIYNSFPDEVKKHWAFPAYAKPLDDDETIEESEASDLMIILETEITELKAQLTEKDQAIDALETEITELKAQLTPPAVLEPAPEAKDPEKEATNAKKQPATNK